MSYILQAFTPPPIKRARESISFASDGASKCGEMFVTNNADQWTFTCAYCPKATSDIGVFICHIRLEHLKVQTDLNPEQTSNVFPMKIDDSLENSSILDRMPELTANSQQQSPTSDIVKEEVTIACSQENLQTSFDKVEDINNFIPKTKDSELFFTITPIRSQDAQQQLISEPVNTQVVYVKNEAEKEYYSNISINEESNNENLVVNDSDSCYSLNEDDGDDSDFEIIEDNTASGSSKNKATKKSIATSEDNSLSSCPYCTLVFRSKKSSAQHILHHHDKELPIRCKKCQRGFFTANSLKMHLRSHEEKNYFQCPVCKTKHLENHFITHVLTHESATCFPCQVCAKIYASQEERKTHWKTHTQEKPFACNICYRRYDEPRYLRRHLKTHKRYCNFCPAKFNPIKDQRPPYVCGKCEKLPDIKHRVEYLKSLIDENTMATLNSVCNVNNSEALSLNVSTCDVYDKINDVTENHKKYECSLCSSVYNTPETQRSPYVCGKCENLHGVLLPEVTIASANTADLTGEIQTNTEDITVNTTNMPGSFNNSNANINDDDGLNDCDSDLEFIDEWHNDNLPSGISIASNAPQTITTPKQRNKCKNLPEGFLPGVAIAPVKTEDLTGEIKTNTEGTSNITANIPGSCNITDDDSDLEFIDDNVPSGSSKNKIRCEKSQRGFVTATGLKHHLKSHDENNQFQCPVCKTKHVESHFIQHVLTHESATCFPCQVCGNIYASREERMTHWKTHAQDKPFACYMCYRRFLKKRHLEFHLKDHNQYLCNFCTLQFNTTEDQRPPYACGKCKKFSDIKRKVKYMQYLNTLTDSNPMFDSDEDTIRTLNSANELGLKHGEELPSSIKQDSAATIESIPNSGSTCNSDSNTRSSYAPNDKIVNSDDYPSTEDGSDLDDTPTVSRIPLAHKCDHCKRDFKTKIGLVVHIRKSLQCQRNFRSKSAINHHTKFHNKNAHVK